MTLSLTISPLQEDLCSLAAANAGIALATSIAATIAITVVLRLLYFPAFVTEVLSSDGLGRTPRPPVLLPLGARREARAKGIRRRRGPRSAPRPERPTQTSPTERGGGLLERGAGASRAERAIRTRTGGGGRDTYPSRVARSRFSQTQRRMEEVT